MEKLLSEIRNNLYSKSMDGFYVMVTLALNGNMDVRLR